MVTITQTVEEFLPTSATQHITLSKTKMNLPPQTKMEQLPPKSKMELPAKAKMELPPQALGCPPDCACKKTSSYKPMSFLFNAIGILVALFAAYMIVTTDSNLYLIFWVCYSVLRRLSKSQGHVKQEKQD